MDYLDWRGDVPFSADPFNHVDNLILAMLAYIDLEGIVPGPESWQWVDIEKAAEEFWSRHTVEEVKEERTLYHLAPMVLKKIQSCPRFAKMQLAGYVNTVSEAEAEQMSAVAFRLDNDRIYVAFRGTDDTITGWKEDFNLSFMEETPGQRKAAAYLSKWFASGEEELLVGGHSKGGNFAVFASAFCDGAVRRRISRVYTNDGPGFLEAVLETSGYREILPRIVSIIPEESVFGLLLNSAYPHTVVKSSNKGLLQHDALSWEVLGNRFVEAPSLNQSSVFAEKTFERWISGISLEERKEFVDSLFKVITAAGNSTVSSLQQGSLKTIFEMVNSFQNLKDHEKNQIRDILQRLLRTGTEVLKEEISTGESLLQGFSIPELPRVSLPGIHTARRSSTDLPPEKK